MTDRKLIATPISEKFAAIKSAFEQLQMCYEKGMNALAHCNDSSTTSAIMDTLRDIECIVDMECNGIDDMRDDIAGIVNDIMDLT